MTFIGDSNGQWCGLEIVFLSGSNGAWTEIEAWMRWQIAETAEVPGSLFQPHSQ